MATLASDNFDRADNTNIGADWTEVVGTWDIASNKLKLTTHGASDDFATWDTALNASPAADYDVEAIVRLEGNVGAAGVAGRFTATNNNYFLFVNTFAQALRMFKVVAGSYTQLGSDYSAGQSNNTDFTLKLSMIGSAIKGYQGGVERASVTDTDITATGKPACFADSSNRLFNDFIVTGTAASAGDGGNDWPTFQSRGFRNWRFSG